MLNINNYFNTDELKRFYCPSKIFSGVDSRNILFELIRNESNVLLVHDNFLINNRYISSI